jgi:cytidyltransferase-like protein
MTYTVAVVSGGFDPVHSGHISMINDAAVLGRVVVLLNSDDWLTRKKGKPFMPFAERKNILENFKNVAMVLGFDDSDNTAIDGLERVKALYPNHPIVFCNGGDRTKENIPEMQVDGITFAFGIGGSHKANSSSWILRDAIATYTEERVWGKFADLYTTTGCKVKELVVKPGQGISYQKHNKRSEVWFVKSGKGVVKHSKDPEPLKNYALIDIYQHDIFVVKVGDWHQLYNESKDDLVIIEIQYGSETNEQDIERLEYYGTT